MSITDEPVANFGAEDDRLQPVDEADGVIRTSANVKTAVVVVHGMGSQKPRETVNGFVRTALENFDGGRIYYSRPDKITGSYEARRLLAIERKEKGAVVQTQTEFFEYHWSYMMTGNQSVICCQPACVSSYGHRFVCHGSCGFRGVFCSRSSSCWRGRSLTSPSMAS